MRLSARGVELSTLTYLASVRLYLNALGRRVGESVVEVRNHAKKLQHAIVI